MREIKIGKKYKHFKGHLYVVEAIAKDSETLESVIVYKNIDTNEYWVRGYEMFNSLVDTVKYPEVEQKYRFEEVGDGNE